ncbi:hypothetical protein EBR21_04810 [bacterium]|nr:hypothetical protein [bacterium]
MRKKLRASTSSPLSPRRHSTFQKLVSVCLASTYLLSSGCGLQNKHFGNNNPRVVKFSDGHSKGLDDVNPVEPVLVDDTVDSDGTRHLSFETPDANSSGRNGSGDDSAQSDDDSAGDADDAQSTRKPGGLPGAYADMDRDGELVSEQREYLEEHSAWMAKLRESCRGFGCEGIEGLEDENSPAGNRIAKELGEFPKLKSKEDVSNELRKLENLLIQEKAQWQTIRASLAEKKAKVERDQASLAESLQRAIESAGEAARQQLESSQAAQKQLAELHNSSTAKLYSALGLDPQARTSEPIDPVLRAPSAFEVEADRQHAANAVLRASAKLPQLNDAADVLEGMARKSAERGDLSSFDLRMQSARDFAWASQHEGRVDQAALKTAVELTSAAKSLENQGLPALSDSAVGLSKDLLQVALDLARFSNIVDVPLSLIEAFTGKTIDFNEDGSAFLRDCTGLERGFAFGTLAIGTGAVLLGAAPVALAAAAAGNVIKAFKEHAIAMRGAAEGAHLLDETLEVARAIEREAPNLMAHGTLTPYAKKHIWYGNIRFSNDGAKIRIDGGVHTVEGVRGYYAVAPVENRALSHEVLPNGVERLIFPDSAFTSGEKFKLQSAAKHGFGVANGKTLFPAHWTPEMIEKAVERAAKEGNVVSVTENGFKKEILHEGVHVIVNFNQAGMPQSAFPRWHQ